MTRVWIVEGHDLDVLYSGLGCEVPTGVTLVAVSDEDDHLRVHVNNGPWSPAIGVTE